MIDVASQRYLKIVDVVVCVEIQAQHRPDRLKKPRTESVWTDRLGRVPSRLGPIDDAKEDIPLGIYLGVSVGAL